jgi:GT2 family glycosyltransferase
LRSISVVIPLWNELDLTRECVRGLSEARAKHGTPHELILVDNGSTDETGDWVEAQQNASDWIRARRLPENLGFAGGCNAGLELATGEYVCFLNNDTLLPMALFERLMSATLRAPNVGLVAPVSNYVKGRQLLEIFADESADDVEQIQARLDAQSARVVEDSPQVAGLCVLLRRELMQEIGGFDERYGLGNYEDDDLCLNIRSRDLRILIARDAYLFHHGNRTFRALGVDYEEQLNPTRNSTRASGGTANSSNSSGPSRDRTLAPQRGSSLTRRSNAAMAFAAPRLSAPSSKAILRSRLSFGSIT